MANRASVVIGTSHDTSDFAVDAIVDWWRREGRRRYGQSSELLILADSGGSNGARSRLWKCALQEKLADRFGLAVTVCHYPPAPPNGIRLSTASSAKSVSTGLANRRQLPHGHV